MRNQKGITLVALVITIIVLLILAGVSISLVVGNNGILGEATSAVVTNKVAGVKEKVSTALASAEMQYQGKWAQGISSGTTTSRKEVYDTKTGDTKYLGSVKADLVKIYTGANDVYIADEAIVTDTLPDAMNDIDNVKIKSGSDIFVFSVKVDANTGVAKIGSTVKYYEQGTLAADGTVTAHTSKGVKNITLN